MAKASDLSNGSYVKYNGELCVVVDVIHRTPGNLRAFYQATMRNLKSGKQMENRFRPDEEVEIVRVEDHDLQYLYPEGEFLVCMNTESFDQYHVSKILFGNGINFLKEGSMVSVSFEGENPINVVLPKSVDLEVTYTEPGMKGDTATRTLKPATLETGAEVSVPLFVDQGEMIRVNPETGEYLARVKEK
jgi:elongation factor P